jgi:hypothetical protein
MALSSYRGGQVQNCEGQILGSRLILANAAEVVSDFFVANQPKRSQLASGLLGRGESESDTLLEKPHGPHITIGHAKVF